jgi:hypothetical protein
LEVVQLANLKRVIEARGLQLEREAMPGIRGEYAGNAQSRRAHPIGF